jgi:small subunit ribosomal protein S20
MATEKKDAKVKQPTAKKRAFQDVERNMRNRVYKSRVRTALRHFESTLEAGAAESSQEALNAVFSLMDKGVKKGIFKQNKASRVKSRLSSKLAPKA